MLAVVLAVELAEAVETAVVLGPSVRIHGKYFEHAQLGLANVGYRGAELTSS